MCSPQTKQQNYKLPQSRNLKKTWKKKCMSFLNNTKKKSESWSMKEGIMKKTFMQTIAL